MNVGIPLGKNISVISGVGYYQNRYITPFVNPDEREKFIKMHYDIPLYFKYQIALKKVNVAPVLGTSYTKILRWGRKVGDEEMVFTKLDGTYTSAHVLNLHTGLAVDYYLNDSFGFTIEPYLDYGTPYFYIRTGLLQLRTHLFNLGVNFGMVYKL